MSSSAKAALAWAVKQVPTTSKDLQLVHAAFLADDATKLGTTLQKQMCKLCLYRQLVRFTEQSELRFGPKSW